MATFPASIDALTSEWLTSTMRTAGILPDGVVTSFAASPIEDGYTASVFRLELEYDATRGDAPAALVVKFHSSSSATRRLFENLGIYEKEVRFYQTHAREHALPVPNCYGAEFNQANGDFVILLEDLSAARQGNWEQDPVGDIRTALTHLAQIHASFWGDPQLQRHNWITQVTDLDDPPSYLPLWEENLAEVKRLYRDQLAPVAWSICDKWLRHWDQVMSCLGQDTHTLVHTDAHLGQMFFPTAELPRFVLFDWQNPSKSWGAEDVIHAIVTDLDIEERRQHETMLINHYYDCLCRQGITDLTRERFLFQCRLSLVWVYFMFFNMIAQPDMHQAMQAEIDAEGENIRSWIFEPLEAVS
ncbi:MAG: DUF1679 domain-containing protein, partial [Gammaproteobacteria bacterium]|nr:DUF1679 domain-containing protein [Gammaproteobacteria bacterium]